MDETIKLTSVSVILGLVAGVLSALFSIGILGITNEVLGFLIAFIVLYGLWKLSDNLASEELDRSQKIWDCFMPFFFTWVIVWTLLSHYL